MRRPRARNGGFTVTELARYLWPGKHGPPELVRELVRQTGAGLNTITPTRNSHAHRGPHALPASDHRPRATRTRNYRPLTAEEAERVLEAYFERLGRGRVLARGKDGRFRPKGVAD